MKRLKSVLAANMKARRKELGLTQEKLAEQVNTAPTYIAMIEAKKRTPSFKMMERLAEVLRIDSPLLFSLKDYPTESVPELHETLMHEFDKFLRAAIRKVKEAAETEKKITEEKQDQEG